MRTTSTEAPGRPPKLVVRLIYKPAKGKGGGKGKAARSRDVPAVRRAKDG